MKLFAWKFSLVVILLDVCGASVSANQNLLEYYSPYALHTQTFASFDSDYLGGRGFFQPTALAEEYLRDDALGVRREIRNKVNEAFPFWSALIPGVDNLRENTLVYIDREFERQQRNWYVGGVWGIAVANSANDPGGPDDLFIAVDHKYGSISFLDFGHPFAFELTDAQEDLVAKLVAVFDINLDDIAIPTVGAYSTPYLDNGDGSDPLNNPLGICTDRRGNFWIADHGNDRVLRLMWDPDESKFVCKGELKGLPGPVDVAVSADDSKTLGIVNRRGGSVVFVNGLFKGISSIDEYGANQKQEIRAVANEEESFALSNVNCIATSSIDPSLVLVAFAGDRIIGLRRDGPLSFAYYGESTTWPLPGQTTCMKFDADGDFYVVDNANCLVGKYKSDPLFTPVFFTGGFYDGDLRIRQQPGFNGPQYLALGADIHNLYVSEKVTKFSGIQRFTNSPRFLDKVRIGDTWHSSPGFRLDCEDQEKLEFFFGLTKSGKVEVEFYRANGHNREFAFKKQLNLASGHHIVNAPFGDNPTGDYLAVFRAYDHRDYSQYSDFREFWAGLDAPGLLESSTELVNRYFNPDISLPTLYYRPTRDAEFIFSLDDPTDGGNVAPTPVRIGEDAEFVCSAGPTVQYRNQEEKNSTTLVNLENADLLKEGVGYLIWADARQYPSCGGPTRFPVIHDRPVFIDLTEPVGEFISMGHIDGNAAINPLSSISSTLPFRFECRDNYDVELNVTVDVFPLGGEQAVRTGVVSRRLPDNGRTVSDYWDGRNDHGVPCAEGSYIFRGRVMDVAGNEGHFASSPFQIDLTPPSVELAASGINWELETYGGEPVLVLGSENTEIQYTITDENSKYLEIHFDLIDPKNGAPISTFLHTRLEAQTSEPAWTGTLTVDPDRFTQDGIHRIRVVAGDHCGNITRYTEGISLNGDAGDEKIQRVWVNTTGPQVLVKAIGNVISSGESCVLQISAYAQDKIESAEHSYTYTVNLQHYESENGLFVTLPFEIPSHVPERLTAERTTIEIPFTHLNYDNLTGQFRFVATVCDNIGGKGACTSQSADLFVDAFPPIIDGAEYQAVPEKFYITGRIGDPDLSNDKSAHGFECYMVFWTEGTVQVLPSPEELSQWRTDRVFVPIHLVERRKDGAGFPLNNIADNADAVTSVWGSATLAYFDGTGLPDGPVTLLFIAKEKGIGTREMPVIDNRNAILHTQMIERRTGLVGLNTTDLKIKGLDGKKFMAGVEKRISIEGNLTGEGLQFADLTALIYPQESDLDNDGFAEPIAARINKRDLRNGSAFEFEWDGKDDKQDYVKSGTYSVALVLEENTPNNIRGGCDYVIIESAIDVETPLFLYDFSIAPNPANIAATPTNFSAPDNIATIECRSSKPCDTYLEIHSENGQYLFTVKPTETENAVRHSLSWTAVDYRTYVPIAPGKYLARVGAQSEGGQHTYLHEKEYPILVGEPAEETRFGEFLLPQSAVYGNSDVVWSAKMKGKVWEFPEVETSELIDITGLQTMQQYGEANFRVEYLKRHTKLNFLTRVYWRARRERKKCGWSKDWVSCTNGPDWLCAVNDQSYDISSRTGGPTKISFTKAGGTNQDFNSSPWYNCCSEGNKLLATLVTATGFASATGGIPGAIVGGTSAITLGSKCDPFGCDSKIAEVSVGRIGVHSTQGTLLDVVYWGDGKDCGNTITESPASIGVFSMSGNPYTTTKDNGNHHQCRVTADISVDWEKFRERGEFVTQKITPNGDTWYTYVEPSFGDARKEIINPDGFELHVKVTCPPGGTVAFKNEPVSPQIGRFNPNPSLTFSAGDQQVSHTFVINKDNAPGYTSADSKIYMLFPLAFSMVPTEATKTHYVVNQPFPFSKAPEVWDDHPWVTDEAGKPIALYGTSLGGNSDFVVSVPIRIQSYTKNISIIDTAYGQDIVDFLNSSVDQKSLSFARYADERTTSWARTLDSGVVLELKIDKEKQHLEVTYDRDLKNRKQRNWNVADPSAENDPVLAEYDYSFKGIIKANDFDGARTDEEEEAYLPWIDHNPGQLYVHRDAFRDKFVPTSEHIGLADAYTIQASNEGVTIPSTWQPVEGEPEPWKVHEDWWKYAMWRTPNGFDFHGGKGMDVLGWDDVRLTYIDGEENACYIVEENLDQGSFSLSISGLAKPRRIIPISYRINGEDTVGKSDLVGIEVKSLSYCNAAASDKSWGSVELEDRVLQFGNNLLGYWDVTHKAGDYYVRVNCQKGDRHYQMTRLVKVGTDVPAEKGEHGFTVRSPLKRVELTFHKESSFSGLIALDPTSPDEVAGFRFGSVPKGVIVDLTPSGTVFNGDYPPQLTFYLSKRDILAAGGKPNRLGEFGVYYLNDETHQLEKAPFAPSIYKLDSDGNRNLVAEGEVASSGNLGDNEVFALSGPVGHFSLYGAISEDAFISIKPPSSPTKRSEIEVSGTAPIGQKDDIYIYLGSSPEWNEDMALLRPDVIECLQDEAGSCRWVIRKVVLPEDGEYYIFAGIGPAENGDEPTNSVKVVLDTKAPTFGSISVSPALANNNTEVVTLQTDVNEQSLVQLTVPQIDMSVRAVRTTRENEVSFLIPLTDAGLFPLPEDRYIAHLVAEDEAGNVSKTKTIAFNIDRTPPTITNTTYRTKYFPDLAFYEVQLNADLADARGLSSARIYVKGNPDIEDRTYEYERESTADLNTALMLPVEGLVYQDGDIIPVIIEVTDFAGNTAVHERPVVFQEHEDLSEWKHSKLVTVNTDSDGAGVYDDLAEFPLLVRLDGANFNFAQAAPGGRDLRFADPEGRFIYSHEIERWDAANRVAEVWVAIPELKGGDAGQTVRMYWGKDEPRRSASASVVWDPSYRAVYHMGPEYGLGAAADRVTLPYFEDFSDISARNLGDFGFTEESFWGYDWERQVMAATTIGGWEHLGAARTPTFFADRALSDVTVSWDMRFPTDNGQKSWRELNKVYCYLLDLNGNPAYRLEFKPNREEDRYTSFDMRLRVYHDEGYTNLSEGHTHTLTPSGTDAEWVRMRMLLTTDGDIEVWYDVGNGFSKYISVEDDRHDLISALRFSYRTGTAEDNYYVEIDNIGVQGRSVKPVVAPEKVSPVLEFVTDDGDGRYTAHFGYSNPNDYPVVIPFGGENSFRYKGSGLLDKGQPYEFVPGRVVDAFTVSFDGSNLIWSLNGKTATAGANAAVQANVSAAAMTLTAAQPVKASSQQAVSPVLERVISNEDGTFTAWFGYNNMNDHTVTIEIGADNGFAYRGTGEQDLGQTTEFLSGRMTDVFSVEFDGSNLVWSLAGRTATGNGDAAEPVVSGEPVDPVLERVLDNGDGIYTAVFGYLNPNTGPVTISVGSENKFSYNGQNGLDLGQATTFQPGRHQDVFTVDFDGSNLVWSLNGRTETASSSAAVPVVSPLSPVLERVLDNENGSFTAWFGYLNPNDEAVTIAIGPENSFTYQGTGGLDKSQPTTFEPGRHVDAFTVTFDGSNLVWHLDGKTATAGRNDMVRDILFDATRFTNHGSNLGAADVDGLVGRAKRFDGVGDFAVCPPVLEPGTKSATISTWLKTSESDALRAIAAMADSEDGWSLMLNEESGIAFTVNSDALISENGSVRAEEWTHLSARINEESADIYVNGTPRARTELLGPLVTKRLSMLIGRLASGGSKYEGLLDEMRVSETDRSWSWIRMAYENQRTRSRVVKTDLVAPVGVTAQESPEEGVVISWDSRIQSADVLRIERRLPGESVWTPVDDIDLPVGTYVDENAECGNNYEYRFHYVEDSRVSPPSAVASVMMTMCPDEHPSDFSASSVGAGKVRLSWTDNSANETGFEIERRRSDADESYTSTYVTEPDVTSYTIDDLICETKYDFRLRAIADDNRSPWLVREDVRAGYCDHRPSKPTNLQVALDEMGIPVLSWTDQSSDEEHFIVYRKDARDEESVFSALDVLSANTASFSDVTAECGMEYVYEIASFNTVPGGGVSLSGQPATILLPVCIEARSAKLSKVVAMITDENGDGIWDSEALITIRLFETPVAETAVYTEEFEVEVRNGHVAVDLGRTGDIASILEQYESLYYEISYNNEVVPPRYPLAASSGTISNPLMLSGIENPTGTVQCEEGCLYLDTQTGTLYFKYGPSVDDWKSLEE